MKALKVLDAISQDVFVRNYLQRNEPVVVKDLMFDEQCWTPHYFKSHLGDLPAQVYDTLFNLQEVSTLAGYLDKYFGDRYFGAPGEPREGVPYVRWYSKLKNVDHAWGDEAFRRLSPHWRMPSFLPLRNMLVPSKAVADAVTDAFPYRGVLVAAKGARTRLHRDPFCSDAVVSQFYGVKEVVMYRPSRAEELRVKSADGSSFGGFVDVRKPGGAGLHVEPDYHGFVRPGEVIYIPHGWLHDVIVVEDSISVTWNFVHEHASVEFIDYLMSSAETDSELEVLKYFYRLSGHNFASAREIVRKFNREFSRLQTVFGS